MRICAVSSPYFLLINAYASTRVAGERLSSLLCVSLATNIARLFSINASAFLRPVEPCVPIRLDALT